MKKYLFFAASGIFILFGLIAVVYAANDTTQSKINALMQNLQKAVQDELVNGKLIDTKYGKTFTDDSAIKMKNLHDQTFQQIDSLTARPESERQAAIQKMKIFSNDQNLNVSYQFTTPSSYNSKVSAEIYYAGFNQYEINALNNEIIQFGPRPLTASDAKPDEYKISPALSYAALEQKAKNIIGQDANIDLNNLTADHSNKDNAMFFFRWVDKSQEVEGMYRFVQVGISKGGELASYTNTFGI